MSEEWNEASRRLYELIDHATRSPRAEIHDGGEFLDAPAGQTAMRVLKIKAPAGRYVLRFVEEPARPAFEWLAELTLDPAEGDYQHFLLRPDGSLLEAYGRELFPVDRAATERLFAEVQAVLSEGG